MSLSPALVVFGIALASAVAGSALEQAPRAARRMLLVSGAALILIAIFLVAPEIAELCGWRWGVCWMAGGFALLWAVDRYLWPLCPSCSHTHDHEECAAPLHGLAAPLIIASGLHSFFDGWSMTAAQATSTNLRVAFVLGLGVHKIFEGIALGAILRASLGSWPRILAGSAAAQGMTVVGGAAALAMAAWVDSRWFAALLGIAGGSFFYLGYHTIEAEASRRAEMRGKSSAMAPGSKEAAAR